MTDRDFDRVLRRINDAMRDDAIAPELRSSIPLILDEVHRLRIGLEQIKALIGIGEKSVDFSSSCRAISEFIDVLLRRVSGSRSALPLRAKLD